MAKELAKLNTSYIVTASYNRMFNFVATSNAHFKLVRYDETYGKMLYKLIP